MNERTSSGEPEATPSVGELSPNYLAVQAQITHLLETEVVAPGVAPAASAAVGRATQHGFRKVAAGAGTRSYADSTTVNAGTIFDLASLTKSIFTTAFARFLCRNELSFGLRLGDVLPRLRQTFAAQATLEQLLSHRAGLEAHVDLISDLRATPNVPFDRARAIERAAQARQRDSLGPSPPHGFAPLYSDLGFILAGEVAECLTGLAVDELVDVEVCQPLGVKLWSARQWRKQGAPLVSFAPTETIAWRGGELVGSVHDDNCFALAGDGCSAHAGLFGRALDVVEFGGAVLGALAGDSRWLESELTKWLVQERPGGSQRVGFDGKSSAGSAAGDRFGPTAIGHLGFTGTSFWCDPKSLVVIALLTNRVCPTRTNTLIRERRPDLHTALFDLAEGVAA